MTSRTPRRHRRLALMAAGTVAAMVLVPGTALAQETPLDVVDALEQVASSVGGAPAGPVEPALDAPGLPAGVPEVPVEVPSLPLQDSDDDSEGHETEDPEFPDHGSGFVGDVDLSEDDLLDLVQYDATIEKDGSPRSDVTVLGLSGDEIIGSGSEGPDGESHENPTEGLCESTGGALCLSLLYQDTYALMNDQGSFAGARGGVLSLCLLGEEETVTTTYECEGLLGAGAAEGEGTAERDGKSGHTKADSVNDLLKACLTEGFNDEFTCEGILGLSVLHSESDSESVTPETNRRSWLIGLDSGGEEILRIEEPTAVTVLDCDEEQTAVIVCLFLNQGESFIFENPQGAGSAQEALHLDLLGNDPATILVELGRAESIAHLESPEGCPPGQKGPCPKKPECDDGVDNDGDGKIDFPKDPGCKDKQDDSEKDDAEAGKKGDGGLAKTGADIAPLLAGAFLLIGMGALTVAVTRRRVGKHTI